MLNLKTENNPLKSSNYTLSGNSEKIILTTINSNCLQIEPKRKSMQLHPKKEESQLQRKRVDIKILKYKLLSQLLKLKNQVQNKNQVQLINILKKIYLIILLSKCQKRK